MLVYFIFHVSYNRRAKYSENCTFEKLMTLSNCICVVYCSLDEKRNIFKELKKSGCIFLKTFFEL